MSKEEIRYVTSSGTESSQSRSRSPSRSRSRSPPPSPPPQQSKTTTTTKAKKPMPMPALLIPEIDFTPIDKNKDKKKEAQKLRKKLLEMGEENRGTRAIGKGRTKKYNNKRKKMQRARTRAKK